MRLRALLGLLLALFSCAAMPALAQADGDPGSDVLVDQNLFTTLWSRQAKLDQLLGATTKAGAPVRVAIISSPTDLGIVTQLWEKPQTYAAYLGQELSLAYTGRLLIVMPDGFGVHWQANPAGASKLASQLSSLKPTAGTAPALVSATVAAVDRIEAAAGVDKPALARFANGTGSSSTQGAGADSSGPTAASSTSSSSTSHKNRQTPTGLFLVALILLGILYVGWRSGQLRKVWGGVGDSWDRRRRQEGGRRRLLPEGVRLRPVALLPTALLAIVVAALVINHASSGGSNASGATLATNPEIDSGTMLSGQRAPNFTLTGQTGQRVSLSQYRGKAVILAFIDAECQTICPLTSQAMLDAKADLGKAGNQVQLLGVNANWKSTQIDDVLNYTQLHGMVGRWQFVTGPSSQLENVWKAYGVNEKALVTKADNEIDHVAALYIIDPQGRERVVFTTYPSYASVPQFGQLLAQKVSKLLPSHPSVSAHYSYAEAPKVKPTEKATLPRLGGGRRVAIGPGKPHLYLFFATWDSQTLGTNGLAADFYELNRYERDAKARGLPQLTAVDEGSVEPSATALAGFISRYVHKPLSYPVAIDPTGRVADGYEVQGAPWFVETNAAGKIVWYQEVYTQGWPRSLALLEHEVKQSLSAAPAGAKPAQKALAESPAPLASLHSQGSVLLPGGQDALDKRITSLERDGYPIVVNIWAQWCGPCQKEFGLFAKASQLYGRRVAFLGADVDDNSADATAFLKAHHVSYPSYSVSDTSIEKILAAGLSNTPTTIYIKPDGKVSHISPGQYRSLGALDGDIQSYTLG